ncbi:leucine-rich repeat protein, partial [uncultured Ruminococcus sp.]|uniref:leucine-rich repeat protein n=1 Tax=uncultured Ruminococcus sp. TaxID=165186 RepID=UPI0025DEF0C8
MKGRIWRKAMAAALALLIVSGSTPLKPVADLFSGTAITASAASTVDVPGSVDTSSFEVITDVKILGADSSGDMEKLENKYKDWGWNVIKQDLNDGAGGWYIYLAYKTTTVTQQSDLNNAIRDIIIVNGSAYGEKTTLSGITDTTLSSNTSRTFYKCESDGDFSSETDQAYKGNLNRGTGSGTPDLYMYYTREAGNDNSLLTSFSLSTSSSGSAYCYNNSGITADLNPSGTAAYLRLNRKSVSASYYGFTANTDLVYNGAAQALASPRSAYHGTVYWSVNDGSWTTSQPKATNAGTYTVKSYVDGDFGFGDSSEVSTTVTIAKSDANKPTVAIDSTIETGTTYAPSIVGMAADRTGAVTYLYSDSQNGEYTSAQPSTEGTYWVKAEIAEDSNYIAYTTAPVSFQIINRSNVTVSASGRGTVTPDKLTALTGETVTLNISPAENYFIKSITVNDEALSPVEGVYSFVMPSQDAAVTAEFAQINSAVVWKNWDGTVLETDETVDYGTTPEYNGDTPTKPMDDDYIYTFSGWSPAISSVEGDIEYTAQFTAAERTGKCGDKAYWSFDTATGKLTISGTGAMYDYEYNYKYNTQPWYNYKDNITSVEIEKGITSIGNYAFYKCTSLTSITIPDSVTSIGDDAFYKCTSLTSITIPDSVTSIGNGAFYNCTSLTSIVIPAKVTNIVADAFYKCTNITDVYCYADPDKLTWNEDSCDDFISNPKHTTVCHVPAEYIDYYNTKFGSSVNVTFKAINPSGECGENAAWELDLDTGKLTISGTGAMYDYSYNTQPWYNYKDNITSVEIENDITSIGNYAFSDCTSLTSIVIPAKVTNIGADAFRRCTSLTSIVIPAKVTNIGADAFHNCTSLTSITIPDSVTSIGDGVFYECTNLESITIPDSVTSIGASAFLHCTSLTSITIPDSVTSIG